MKTTILLTEVDRGIRTACWIVLVLPWVEILWLMLRHST